MIKTSRESIYEWVFSDSALPSADVIHPTMMMVIRLVLKRTFKMINDYNDTSRAVYMKTRT